MSLGLFRATFHDSGIPQAIKSLDGTIIDANEAFCHLLGYDDLCGVTSKALIPEDERVGGFLPAEHLKSTRSYLAHKRYLKKNGAFVWVNVYYSAIHEDGHMLYILAQVVDLSHERALEIDLQTKQNEIERFAYIASHDLREPLSTIAGYATLLKKRCQGQLSESGEHWLEEIIAGTERMAEKVDDLLAFSRAGRNTPQGDFPLGAAVEEGKRALARKFRETSGTVEIVGDLPVVAGDRSMVANVFQNLFSNSLKYCGEKTPLIKVKAEKVGAFWQVSVADNGLGFDSKQFGTRVFEVFQRLYTVEQFPGTGIGLAISKKIIERHGGAMWVEAEPDQGATFFFTLPDKS